MKVLGIDPGIGTTGCVLVSEIQGKFSLLSGQAITTPIRQSTDKRLIFIYQEILAMIKNTKPDVAALETLIFNTNVTTAFAVGQARGVILLALAHMKVPVSEYTPIQVKMSITGYGRADKNQIQQMIKTILGLPQILKPDDIADAAAIALTHLFSYKLSQKTINKQ